MIEITDKDFSSDEVISKMDSPRIGAVITYVGVVRGFSEGREVAGLEFSADEAAINKLRELDKVTLKNFDVLDVAIVHRLGRMKVGDRLLLIAISTSHRQAAFDACMSVIDGIKAIHADWAKEYYKG